ncbi:hypothetical protein [Bacillus sp. P14.5]|uniref:hypothetical protein n=1 Tax=Bacillus sp. P14.5 TaxID=1983400 RepID=UPI000DEA2217|nr:hypothetical protein [Bacillus sp. P14.5]
MFTQRAFLKQQKKTYRAMQYVFGHKKAPITDVTSALYQLWLKEKGILKGWMSLQTGYVVILVKLEFSAIQNDNHHETLLFQ